jgi:hypothetical protein
VHDAESVPVLKTDVFETGPRLRERVQIERESGQLKATGGVHSVTESRSLVNAALEVSMRRRTVLALMRKALESGDERQALQLARQLCGLESGHETGHRTDSSIN